MVTKSFRSFGTAILLGFTFPLSTVAEGEMVWDQQRVTALAASLYTGVKGLRDEIRKTPQDVGPTKGWKYLRLMDTLRLLERETGHLRNRLESGAGRNATLPAYTRIAILRRDCEEEMERQNFGSSDLRRIERARLIVREMDTYYGMDPERHDHGRVRGRQVP